MGRYGWRCAGLAALILAGCTQTSGSGTTSTLASLTPVGATMTTVAPTTGVVTATNMSGFVVNVLDGRTFDLQPIKQGSTRLTLGLITVPDIGTCEGTAARSLLAQLIAGKQVTIDAAGILTVGDIPDVGLTMIQYGYAQPSPEAPGYYVEDSKLATPFNCVNTTTTTAPAVIVVQPPRTRPPRTTGTVAETDPTPVETATPETEAPTQAPVTAPPIAQPPREPDPPATPATRAPEPVVTAEDTDAAPRTPRTPRTPAPPASE